MTDAPAGWLARLALMGTGHAGSDYLDFIVRSGYETPAVAALARALGQHALTVRLDHLQPSSVASRVAAHLAQDGWSTAVAPGGDCPVIRLVGHTWESLLTSLGPSHRANVRRRLKQLGAAFDMRFTRVAADDERRVALTALAGWHRQRFERCGGSTAFMTPELCAFHDEATRAALDAGWLRMYLLRLDETPAAVMYGFMYDRQFYFYQHGFDERYGRYSVGLVLMAQTIRAAIDEGAETFDLLWGTESYKALWTQERRQLQQIHLFSPRFSGRLHRRAMQARRHIGTLARRVLRPREAARGA
jgi:CelD/BcsL family acetyltransferase involved in cellulose biosynthesis